MITSLLHSAPIRMNLSNTMISFYYNQLADFWSKIWLEEVFRVPGSFCENYDHGQFRWLRPLWHFSYVNFLRLSKMPGDPKILLVETISRTDRDDPSTHWYLFRRTLPQLQCARTFSWFIVQTLQKALESRSLSKFFSSQGSPRFRIWNSSLLVLCSRTK
jgi:hypothetical protein